MKTLTITDARKNLSRWLQAAARGEDVGIVCGADVIALRKVAVESTDYARREYGATEEEVARFAEAAGRRFARLRRGGRLTVCHTAELKRLLEETARD
jgi:antitoxin (DNA-binding transcriptional repressor) of toxin-antitoxin stability system